MNRINPFDEWIESNQFIKNVVTMHACSMLFKNLVKKATLNAQSILDTVGLLTGTVCLQRSTAQHRPYSFIWWLVELKKICCSRSTTASNKRVCWSWCACARIIVLDNKKNRLTHFSFLIPLADCYSDWFELVEWMIRLTAKRVSSHMKNIIWICLMPPFFFYQGTTNFLLYQNKHDTGKCVATSRMVLYCTVYTPK